MRLILEKAEIVAVLSKHFDAQLDPENVIIRTDPFEIEVCGLPLSSNEPPPEDNVRQLPSRRVEEAPARPTKVAKARADDNATEDAPPPGLDGTDPTNAAEIHPAAVLAASKALEAELDRENPQLAKRRAGAYSHTPPSYDEDKP